MSSNTKVTISEADSLRETEEKLKSQLAETRKLRKQKEKLVSERESFLIGEAVKADWKDEQKIDKEPILRRLDRDLKPKADRDIFGFDDEPKQPSLDSGSQAVKSDGLVQSEPEVEEGTRPEFSPASHSETPSTEPHSPAPSSTSFNS